MSEKTAEADPHEDFASRLLSHSKITCINLEENYKLKKKLDSEGTFAILLSYNDLQTVFAIRTDYPRNIGLIEHTFEKFEQDKRKLERIKADCVILPIEIFVDKRFLDGHCNPRVWKIFQPIEYILHCPYYLYQPLLLRKHFIKHFHENELLKILHDLLELLRHLAEQNARINFLNFYIVFAQNKYKFLIHSLIDSNSIQEDFEEQMKYSVFILYGLLKEMIFVFYNTKENSIEQLVSLGKEKKLDRFVHAFAIFKAILVRDGSSLVSAEGLERLLLTLLEDYLNTLYVFKNKEVFLLDQPLFRYVKRLHLEVSSNVERISFLLQFIASTLTEKTQLSLIYLKISDCMMNTKEAIQIITSLSHSHQLEYLLLDFSFNNIDDTIVDSLSLIPLRQLKSFKFDISGFDNQN